MSQRSKYGRVVFLNRMLLLQTLLLSLSAGIAAPNSTVEFRIVDEFGHVLPFSMEFFQAIGGRHELSHLFNNLRAEGIPYGQYRYRLKRKDAPRVTAISGQLDVSEPQILKLLLASRVIAYDDQTQFAVRLSRPGGPINGRIVPVPKQTSRIWLRFQAMFSESSINVPVDPQGGFIISQPLTGPYILMV